MAEQKLKDVWHAADEEVRKNLPPGVKLVRTLRGHTGYIGRIAWSPTPRAMLATPMGASNLDAIIDEGTLTIGWVGPALLGILIAAFGWAGRVFEWLGTLATWLFSGEWRDSGPVER